MNRLSFLGFIASIAIAHPALRWVLPDPVHIPWRYITTDITWAKDEILKHAKRAVQGKPVYMINCDSLRPFIFRGNLDAFGDLFRRRHGIIIPCPKDTPSIPSSLKIPLPI